MSKQVYRNRFLGLEAIGREKMVHLIGSVERVRVQPASLDLGNGESAAVYVTNPFDDDLDHVVRYEYTDGQSLISCPTVKGPALVVDGDVYERYGYIEWEEFITAVKVAENNGFVEAVEYLDSVMREEA